MAVPTVAEAADAARVSRATAYRYFPTQEALQVELDSSRVNAPIEKIVASFTSNNPGLRVAALIDAYCDLALGEEAHMRTALRVYQDTWLRGGDSVAAPQVRKGRRMKWLADRARPAARHASGAVGPLARRACFVCRRRLLVILKDVVGLDHSEANAVLKWAASALLRAGLDDA